MNGGFQKSLWNLLIHRTAPNLTRFLASEYLSSPVCSFNPYILKPTTTKTQTNNTTNLPKKPQNNLHLSDKNNGQDFAVHIGRNTSVNNLSAVVGYRLYGTCTEALLVTVATEPGWHAFLSKMFIYSYRSPWKQNIITFEKSVVLGGFILRFTAWLACSVLIAMFALKKGFQTAFYPWTSHKCVNAQIITSYNTNFLSLACNFKAVVVLFGLFF